MHARVLVGRAIVFGLILAAQVAGAQDQAAAGDLGELPKEPVKLRKIPGFSPYAGRNYPIRVYWGDQHVHTGWSVDAGLFGCTLGPEEALRFARGEEVIASTGTTAKLSRPLDWIAVTDHSDMAGTIQEIRVGNPNLVVDPTVKRWHDLLGAGEGVKAASEIITAQSNGKIPTVMLDPKLAASIWAKSTAIMEKYNEPGHFTAFIGYEWTSNAGGGDNLHRNVIYRDGKDKADQVIPMTTFDSENPEDLWKWMAAWEKKTGGRLLAIPHNGNLSNGRMFALNTFLGDPLTREYAETRARWEPVYEATQIKGDGETQPSLSPTDEFAGFEKWDTGNLVGVAKKPGMLQFEYVRRALENGLALEQKLGANPFKYGLVGGTDTHTGLTTAEEENFFGKHTGVEPGPSRWEHVVIQTKGNQIMGWQMQAAGYTGVWATENTREALWDALKRKEVYTTTGPRMVVRFFGGWDFKPKDALRRDPGAIGYEHGVPMGGDLHAAPAGKSPTFIVAALKDPIGANLDRIQVIKGSLDRSGKIQERIYDVVWSGTRKKSVQGKVPPVGNTVDVAEATWTNTIGAPELIAVWRDPDFDPKLRAFYYVRVLEIPTPRWTAYEAKRFNITLPKEVPMVLQERAYTSPIWYSPEKS
jgi:Protein of unknown function (DUF3604)